VRAPPRCRTKDCGGGGRGAGRRHVAKRGRGDDRTARRVVAQRPGCLWRPARPPLAPRHAPDNVQPALAGARRRGRRAARRSPKTHCPRRLVPPPTRPPWTAWPGRVSAVCRPGARPGERGGGIGMAAGESPSACRAGPRRTRLHQHRGDRQTVGDRGGGAAGGGGGHGGNRSATGTTDTVVVSTASRKWLGFCTAAPRLTTASSSCATTPKTQTPPPACWPGLRRRRGPRGRRRRATRRATKV